MLSFVATPEVTILKLIEPVKEFGTDATLQFNQSGIAIVIGNIKGQLDKSTQILNIFIDATKLSNYTLKSDMSLSVNIEYLCRALKSMKQTSTLFEIHEGDKNMLISEYGKKTRRVTIPIEFVDNQPFSGIPGEAAMHTVQDTQIFKTAIRDFAKLSKLQSLHITSGSISIQTCDFTEFFSEQLIALEKVNGQSTDAQFGIFSSAHLLTISKHMTSKISLKVCIYKDVLHVRFDNFPCGTLEYLTSGSTFSKK